MIRIVLFVVAAVMQLSLLARADAGIVITMHNLGDVSSTPNQGYYTIFNDTTMNFNQIKLTDGDLSIGWQSASVPTPWSHTILDHSSPLTQTFPSITFSGSTLLAGQTLTFDIDKYFDPDANTATNNAIGGNFTELLFGTQFEFRNTLGDTYAFTSNNLNTNLAGTVATFDVTAVPEPSSFALAGFAVIGGVLHRWRRKKPATS